MGKKTKQPPPVPTETKKLTHSPFAALAPASATNAAEAPLAPPADDEPAAVAPAPTPQKPRGRLILRRETQHRGGKPVVIVSGIASTGLGADEVDALGSALKRALGCGGTVEWVRDTPEIVLQGDHPSKVAELLRARGFRVGGVTG